MAWYIMVCMDKQTYYMTAAEVAEECKTDTRNICRWARDHCFEHIMIPHPNVLGSKMMAFDEKTAKRIISIRTSTTKKKPIKDRVGMTDAQYMRLGKKIFMLMKEEFKNGT